MSERSKRSGDARDQRQRRLADALRTNLKRRKAQQRERSSAGTDGMEPSDNSKTGESG